MKKFRYFLLSAAFTLVLSATSNNILVEAATADDLREMIGERRLTDETRMADIKKVLYQYQQTNIRNELIELLDMTVQDYERLIEEKSRERDEREQDLKNAFQNGKGGAEVLSSLRDVRAVAADIGDINDINSYVLEQVEIDETLLDYFKSLSASIGETFNLGVIGEGLQTPLMGPIRIVEPFGLYQEVTDVARLKENDHIILGLPFEDSIIGTAAGTVVSQFNGTVKEIRKIGINTDTKEPLYEVTMEHGLSVTTIYSPIKNLEVKVGEEVSQYQPLGVLEKEELTFQVNLNGVPIQPLFLYGGSGKRAYETFYAANPGLFVSKEDFSHIKTSIGSTGNYSRPAGSSVVIEEDGTTTPVIIEGQTEKPDAPVVEHIGGN